ncbi:low affinity immunoglobulin epsilon Fc receptor-like isoform X3 [Ciona intestinalis]
MKLFAFCCILSCLSVAVGQITWHQLGTSEYYIHDGTKVNYQAAVSACALLNATLARVKTTQVQQFLVQKINKRTSYYIGLERINPTPTGFQWNDGTSVTSGETQWSGEGYPDNSGGRENCVQLSKQWNDISCGTTMKYICERHADIIVNGSFAKVVSSTYNSYTMLDVMYKMCFDAAPYKVEASARMLDESLPYRFNVITTVVQPHFFRIKLERVDIYSGWSPSEIKISWKAYFNTTIQIY